MGSLAPFTFRDALDITLLAVLYYVVLRFLRGTRAAQMGVGFAILLAGWALTGMWELTTLHLVLGYGIAYLPFLAIVVFQASIRAGLAGLGSRLFGRFFRVQPDARFVDEMVHVVFALSRRRWGALLVFERSQGLRPYAESGIQLDAVPSHDLLLSVFMPGNSLHDGAVILRGRRVVAASCFLPLTRQPLPGNPGTRHRAAIGISEETDAVAIVVSEETGGISLCVGGKIRQRLTEILLQRLLRQYLYEETSKAEARHEN